MEWPEASPALPLHAVVAASRIYRPRRREPSLVPQLIPTVAAKSRRKRMDMGEANGGLIRLEGISKSFGAIQALSHVSIDIGRGEVVGLMGDNGAGKSTLVKILAGNYRPTEGTYLIDGQPVSFANPAEARARGIEVVYQDLALCNNLTAAANVFLGREIMRKARSASACSTTRPWPCAPASSVQGAAVGDAAARPRRAHVGRPAPGGGDRPHPARRGQADPHGRADGGDQRAPGRAGPGADRAAKDQGHSVVLISHRMPDVFTICDRVVVLRRGRKVADKPIAPLARGSDRADHRRDRYGGDPCSASTRAAIRQRPPTNEQRQTTVPTLGHRSARGRRRSVAAQPLLAGAGVLDHRRRPRDGADRLA